MIVHLLVDEKFTIPYIDFLVKNFKKRKNVFFVLTRSKKNMRYCSQLLGREDVFFITKNPFSIIRLFFYLIRSKKIILQGMYNMFYVRVLNMLNFAKKTYWMIWGGDMYSFEFEDDSQKQSKTKLISRLGKILTPFYYDYLYAVKNYEAKCEMIECVLPTSIIEIDQNTKPINNKTIRYLIGNSADIENEHFDLIDKLATCDLGNAEIYIPLSYGDKEYANNVIKYAKEKLAGKAEIKPLLDFMGLKTYNALLASIDVAIFNHKRQQAFNNIIQLVGYGSKVYLRNTISTYAYLKDKNIIIYDVEELHNASITKNDEVTSKNNIINIRQALNYDAVVEQWEKVLA